MNSDPASLDNLREIIVPPPVPWWPLAPVGGSLFAVLSLGSPSLPPFVRGAVAGRTPIAVPRCGNLRHAENVAAIAEILKRTALVAYPRTDVASLSGSAWLAWLAETGGRPVPAAVDRSPDDWESSPNTSADECRRSRRVRR